MTAIRKIGLILADLGRLAGNSHAAFNFRISALCPDPKKRYIYR
jgi:hypothetical protein